METDTYIYQNAQFNNSGNGAYLRFTIMNQSLTNEIQESEAPKKQQEFPKIDSVKIETDLT